VLWGYQAGPLLWNEGERLSSRRINIRGERVVSSRPLLLGSLEEMKRKEGAQMMPNLLSFLRVVFVETLASISYM